MRQGQPERSRRRHQFLRRSQGYRPGQGLQAERARIPFAATTLVRLPDGVSDDQAILVSDIFPTGWYGAILAEVKTGNTVAVFGCGPVGQFAIASASLQGATRVIAVDSHPDRLAMARRQGAFPVNFDEEDPVAAIKQLTGGTGADRAIDAVGVDAQHAHHGPAGEAAKKQESQNKAEVAKLVPDPHSRDGIWVPGDAPGQALEWAIAALAKAGTLGIIGVYPPTATRFPIGKLMNKNLSLNAGNCNHRAYIPALLELVRAGTFDPRAIITQHQHLTGAIEAYEAFDRREAGWIKTELQPAA